MGKAFYLKISNDVYEWIKENEIGQIGMAKIVWS